MAALWSELIMLIMTQHTSFVGESITMPFYIIEEIH